MAGHKAGSLLAEAGDWHCTTVLTRKATKDVASDLAGEVFFADLVPEEKPTVKAILRQRHVKAV